MKYAYSLFAALTLSCSLSFSQITPIADIQTVSSADLAAGMDESPLLGQTVTIQGVVTANPCDYALSTSSSRVGTFLQEIGGAPNSAVHVLVDDADIFQVSTANGFQDNFVVGNLVECTGVISTFANNTQVVLTTAPTSIVSLNQTIDALTLPISTFSENDGAGGQTMNLTDGEPYEGMLVRFDNVTVVDIQANGDRYFWSLQDGSGNKIEIRDLSGHIRNGNTDDFCTGGDDVSNTPDQFDAFDYQGQFLSFVQGNIMNYTVGGELRFGLAVRNLDDIGEALASPPIVSANITRSPVVATSADDVAITATITDDDGTIDAAEVCYSLDPANLPFVCVTLTDNNDETFSGSIPAQADQSLVYYYVHATDDEGNETFYPDATSGNVYFVTDAGINSIADFQYAIADNGNSIWAFDVLENINVEATLTAGPQAFDIGGVYVQDGTDAFSGIRIFSSSDSSFQDLKRGDKIMITKASVFEFFGVTQLEDVEYTKIASTGDIAAITTLDMNDLIANNAGFSEQYENMLVTFNNVFVTSNNPDDPSNFGEWQIGNDNTPDTGIRCDDVSNNLPIDFNVDVLTLGQELTDITGILTFSFGNWKILPRNLSDIAGYQTEYPKEITVFDITLTENANTLNLFGGFSSTDEIIFDIPDNYDVTNITPVIQFNGESINPAMGEAIDLTTPVTYTVTACIDGSTRDYIVTANLVSSVNDFEALNVTVQPTITNNFVNIIGAEMINNFKTINIFDEAGKTIYTTNEVVNSIDFSNFSNGMYIIEISNFDNKKLVSKILKY